MKRTLLKTMLLAFTFTAGAVTASANDLKWDLTDADTWGSITFAGGTYSYATDASTGGTNLLTFCFDTDGTKYDTSNKTLRINSVATVGDDGIPTANYIKFTIPAGYSCIFQAGYNVTKNAGSYKVGSDDAVSLPKSWTDTSIDKDDTQDRDVYIYLTKCGTQNKAGIKYVTMTNNTSTYTYVVNASVNGQTQKIAASEEAQGYNTNIKVPYQRFILDGTTLYEAKATSNSYNYTFTLGQGDNISDDNVQTETIEYGTAAYENVVFYAEGEAIEGMTENTSFSNVGNRASNAAVGVCADTVKVTTLPVGTYTIGVKLFGSVSSFKAFYGDTEITWDDDTQIKAQGLPTATITLTGETAINVTSGESGGIDFIYIQTEDAETITAETEYRTFCSADKAIDFSNSDLKAYTAAYDESQNAVVLTEVQQVPAGTGVILYNADYANTTKFTVDVIESASELSGNELVGLTAKTTVKYQEVDSEATSTYNYLLNNGAFYYPVEDGVSVAAGRAYLATTKNVKTSEAKSIKIIFAGTTGINSINAAAQNGKIYNLQGIEVSEPTQGLYIKNGKKIIK